MAYHGPPQSGEPPPRYEESHSYAATAPSAAGPTMYGSEQGPPPAQNYGQPVHIAVPNAFARYSDSAPSAAGPTMYGSEQGPPPEQNYGRPVHIAVPNAFARYSDSGPGVQTPLKYDNGQGFAPAQPIPAAQTSVPYAFDRYSESGQPLSGATQTQPTSFMTDFSDHTAGNRSLGAAHYSYSSSFSDRAIRRAFIKKVYLILTVQLCVTIGFIALFIFLEPLKNWIQRDGLWTYIVAYVIFLIVYFVLICIPSVRRKSPGNFICLAIFTVAFSYLTATISSFHDTKIVLLAAGITGAVCLAISIFAVQTKIDFTLCSGLLFALVMVLFFFGIACMVTFYCWGYNHIMDTVYAGLGALVFALFLVYNTQQIVGGRKHELSAEEYIYGALQLYLDVVYIFIFILALTGRNK
ncbi:protein lifeguard 2-like [Babylonia areolata]|uniref:protein lifeguard 2-like n=1 Tax=Babylonia areolata TaxID=304850 RepID=UPI003FD0EC60